MRHRLIAAFLLALSLALAGCSSSSPAPTAAPSPATAPNSAAPQPSPAAGASAASPAAVAPAASPAAAAAPPSGPRTGGTLRFGQSAADLGTLDPHYASGTQDRSLVDMVYNALVRYKPGDGSVF